MLAIMIALLLPLALAHGPHEDPTQAASLDTHERYELPDPLPESPDALVVFGDVELMGSYNRQTIASKLEAQSQAARTCYQMGLDDAEHPAGTGRIVYQTTLFPSALKAVFTIGTNTLEHPEVEDCVARVLKNLALPAPVRGMVTVSFPVEFAGRESAQE